MGILSEQPQIVTLKQHVEDHFGKVPEVHNDFVILCDHIFKEVKIHISETTLERLWNYSTRSCSTVSLHTLNVLSMYCGFKDWKNFCESLQNRRGYSEFFDEIAIYSSELKAGDRLKIGWLPDRVCVIRYQGNNNFIAEECCNSTMKAGDSFTCLQFILHHPATLENFKNEKGLHNRYVIGRQHGLTLLSKLPSSF